MPLRIFQNKTLAGANAVGVLLGGSFFAYIFIGTLYMQQVLGYSALKAGLAWLEMALISVAFAGLSQALVTRGGAKLVMAAGMAMIGGGILWSTQVPVHGHFWASLAAPFFIVGVGTAFAFIPVSIAGLAGVAEQEAGLASGLLNTSQQLGGAVGVAIASTIPPPPPSPLLPPGTAPAPPLTSPFPPSCPPCRPIAPSPPSPLTLPPPGPRAPSSTNTAPAHWSSTPGRLPCRGRSAGKPGRPSAAAGTSTCSTCSTGPARRCCFPCSPAAWSSPSPAEPQSTARRFPAATPEPRPPSGSSPPAPPTSPAGTRSASGSPPCCRSSLREHTRARPQSPPTPPASPPLSPPS